MYKLNRGANYLIILKKLINFDNDINKKNCNCRIKNNIVNQVIVKAVGHNQEMICIGVMENE